MKLLALLQTKAVVTVLASVLLVGGATAAFAATPAGQTVVQSITHAHPTASAAATHSSGSGDQSSSAHGQKTCPGLPDAQHLATSYHLSDASNGTAVTAICALHTGTFTSMTTAGVKVTVSRVYGYGEINQLLIYAQFLATHNSANAGGALSDTTVDTSLADALHSCGSMPLEHCLVKNIPGFTPGTGQDNQPTGTPTTGKPDGTPIPNGNKPTGTPTPHH